MYIAAGKNFGSLAVHGTAPPVEDGSNTVKRKRMGEEPHDTHQAVWEKYMEVEHRELEQRQSGQLGRALPGESQEELDRIAEEDQRRAKEGLVELRTGDEVWYKLIDKLTRDDRQARIDSENARAARIRERLSRQPRPE
jgi:hypothetical protein